MNPRRVLLADDHEPWRRQIVSLLPRTDEWCVVGEAVDGRDAVQRSAALNPDLILLDIELPVLNGIEAARQIIAANPAAKILFVTAHQAWDIAEAALSTGARGYILKPNAGRELVPAMDAVAAGRRFVTSAFGGCGVASVRRDAAHLHEIGFYADDAALVRDFARFAETELRSGRTLIVNTSAPRRVELARLLQAQGLDIGLAIRQGRYINSDADEIVTPLMVDDWPDESRFWQSGIPLMLRAARASNSDNPGMAACGDGTATLWKAGKMDAALRLEQLWDEMSRTFNLDILCAFPEPDQSRQEQLVRKLCAGHTAVIAR